MDKLTLSVKKPKFSTFSPTNKKLNKQISIEGSKSKKTINPYEISLSLQKNLTSANHKKSKLIETFYEKNKIKIKLKPTDESFNVLLNKAFELRFIHDKFDDISKNIKERAKIKEKELLNLSQEMENLDEEHIHIKKKIEKIQTIRAKSEENTLNTTNYVNTLRIQLKAYPQTVNININIIR